VSASKSASTVHPAAGGLFDPLSGSILATPTLAVVPLGAVSASASRIDCHNLALPVSAVFLPGTPGDVDGDGDVDLADFGVFAGCLAGPGQSTPPGGCTQAQFTAADFDADQNVDEADFAVFQAVFPGS